MRVLLLGADTPVGHSLRAFMPPLHRHELLLLSLDDSRWRRERQAKKMIKSAAPDLIIDARLISQMESADPLGQPDLERTRWLAGLVAKTDARYVFLSSSQVFGGSLSRPYRESDVPDALGGAGLILAQAEAELRAVLERVVVLRLGWVFAGRGPGRFKQLLDRLREGHDIHVTDCWRDCPVHTAEVARVVSGVVDQLAVGANDKGTYHYGSAGDTGYYNFCEAVVAHASQREPFSQAASLLKEIDASTISAENRALDCSAIRHQFGIQQRPWRDFIERAVGRYIELYCKEGAH